MQTKTLLLQKPPGTDRAAFSFCAIQRVHILPWIKKRPIRPGRFSVCATLGGRSPRQPPSRGPESWGGPPDLSGDPAGPVARLAATEGVSVSLPPEGGAAACRGGRSFSLCCFSCVILFLPDSFSRPAGASSLGEGAFRDGGSGPREGALLRSEGAEVACRLARRIAFLFCLRIDFCVRGI